jgi:signal transduction histidine kinase
VTGRENLPLPVQAELYNIAQEALNNALKHAGAQRVRVNLHHGDEFVEMEICDDGIGFQLESARQSGGFGISGMDERTQRIHGRLEISSELGQGTRVSVRVPISRIENGGGK